MKAVSLSLRKHEILRGYQTFSSVIAEGQLLQKGAVRCFFVVDPQPRHSMRAGFSVSRSIGNAFERNRARRWMREAYRKNKAILLGRSLPAVGKLSVVFLYSARGGAPRRKSAYAAVEQAMIAILGELQQQLSKNQ